MKRAAADASQGNEEEDIETILASATANFGSPRGDFRILEEGDDAVSDTTAGAGGFDEEAQIMYTWTDGDNPTIAKWNFPVRMRLQSKQLPDKVHTYVRRSAQPRGRLYNCLGCFRLRGKCNAYVSVPCKFGMIKVTEGGIINSGTPDNPPLAHICCNIPPIALGANPELNQYALVPKRKRTRTRLVPKPVENVAASAGRHKVARGKRDFKLPSGRSTKTNRPSSGDDTRREDTSTSTARRSLRIQLTGKTLKSGGTTNRSRASAPSMRNGSVKRKETRKGRIPLKARALSSSAISITETSVRSNRQMPHLLREVLPLNLDEDASEFRHDYRNETSNNGDFDGASTINTTNGLKSEFFAINGGYGNRRRGSMTDPIYVLDDVMDKDRFEGNMAKCEEPMSYPMSPNSSGLGMIGTNSWTNLAKQPPDSRRSDPLSAACVYCQRQFECEHRLRAHISLKHFKYTPFNCEHCEFAAFTTLFAVRAHHQQLHPNLAFDAHKKFDQDTETKETEIEKAVKASLAEKKK